MEAGLKSGKTLNKDWRRGIYVITDGSRGSLLYTKVTAALAGGACMIQYREKSTDARRRLEEARRLLELCGQFGVPLIINDDVKLAQKVGAAGVHLGRDDGQIRSARMQLGPDAIIGASCYADAQLATEAAEAGASYLAFGAVFGSTTKPDAPLAPMQLFATNEHAGLPLCAIGGIDETNIGILRQLGVQLVAVINTVNQAANIEQATRRLNALLLD
jgi:thiamine-phosphate pyrophosphorylase